MLACEELLEVAEAAPPVSLSIIASLRGIVEIREQEQPWAGMLAPKPATDNFIVSVRSADSWERQRFTVGHEVVHTFFSGFSSETQFRCNGESSRLEKLCDLGATELLFPRRFFLEDLASAPFSLESVERLSTRYGGSIEATALRTVDLWQPEPTMLLALSERFKPIEQGREATCEPRLRLDYGHCRGRWPYRLRHKSVADDSALSRAFAGKDVREMTTIDELFAEPLGEVEVHARRYGSRGRVLALVRHRPNHRPRRN